MRTALFSAVLFFACTAFAADQYKIDKEHSNVGFSVKHLVISTVKGRFTDFDGTIVYDENDLSKSSVNLKIRTASVNTDNSDRDNDLRQSEFFDAQKYPEISFHSKEIKKTPDGIVAVGTLTMKDVSKEIEVPFTITGKINDPWGNERLAVEGGTQLNRQDYHLTYSSALKNGSAIVGNEVKVNFTVEATQPLASKAHTR